MEVHETGDSSGLENRGPRKGLGGSTPSASAKHFGQVCKWLKQAGRNPARLGVREFESLPAHYNFGDVGEWLKPRRC